jgi:RecA-family ATPase
VQRLSFLRTVEKNASALDLAGFKQLDSLLVALRPDLVILDPLVALCGGGNTNDNAAMSLVMRELKSLAIKFDCAVLIIHHTRKGGDLSNAEAISGASSIVNLARHATIPTTMTDNEAKGFGVLPSERLQYFKLVDAKSNLAPRAAEALWYELASEELPNAEPPIYPHGDRVQAVTRAQLTREKTSPFAGPEQQTIRFEILKLIDRGLTIDGERAPVWVASEGTTLTQSIREAVETEAPKLKPIEHGEITPATRMED